MAAEKTTTIGKLAAQFVRQGKKSAFGRWGHLSGRCSTATGQFGGERSGCEVVTGAENADPSSVIVSGLERAKAIGADIVLLDTAGRLHTKVGLMDELGKVYRSIRKRISEAPHETLLVLDASMGQNAIAQAKMFKEVAEVSGLILTKLDGTAKGGVVVGICDELGLPVPLYRCRGGGGRPASV